MTWVRYDDNVRNHPKVEPLDDATYRLWREAIEWCAQNLTDGVILTRQLGLTSIRASPARARKLVGQQLWHPSGGTCSHEKCPPSGMDGWVVHDYWDYNPTAKAAREEQEKARERKRKWLEAKKNGSGNGVPDSVPNGANDSGNDGNPAPPRPAPKGRGGSTSHQRPADADHGSAATAGRGREEIISLAIAACRICDDRGYTNGRVCDHDPATAQRARQGVAAARKALEKRTA